MKRFLKSSLSLVLALTIVLSSALVGLGEIDFGGIFAVKASAASVSDLTFGLNNDGESYSVIGCSESSSGELVIPSTYNGLSVTSINKNAFQGCSRLTSVTIPDSVTSIGEYAFYGCDMLYDFKIENLEAWCLIEFGANMINHSPWNLYLNDVLVTNLIIPENITEIKDFAFDGCGNITSVFIPEGVTRIGDFAFSNNHSLIEVDLPNGITDIGSSAFSATGIGNNTEIRENGALYIDEYLIEVYELTSENYIIKDGTVLIAGNAFGWTFSDDIQLHTVEIPDSVKYICDNAFSHCESLSEIVIPDSVTSIGSYVFYNCTSLTSLIIPDSVTSIGSYAFCDCTSLIDITIGSGVTSIGEYAFYNCDSLASVYITDIASWCNIDFVGDYSNPMSYANFLYINGELPIDIVIPYGVKTIPINTFNNLTTLTSITIPDSVTSIGEDAFYGCTGLTSITIPDSVTSIGSYAFCDCTSLIDITIGSGVTSIGEYAFYNCDSLASVYITDIASWCNIDFVGDYSNPMSYANFLYINGELPIDIVIPYGVKTIPINTFNNLTTLTSITIPDSVTSIGEDAFYGCTGLTSITIPDSVTSIGEYAFYDCYNLWHVLYKGNEDDWNSINIGESNSNLISAVRHYNVAGDEVTSIITVAPTCTERGYDIYCCNTCGQKCHANWVDSLGHQFNDGVCNICGKLEEDCIESPHPYPNDCDQTWTITKDGAEKIAITFSKDTYTESGFDYIYIYDGDNNQIAEYSGTELAERTITVNDDTVKIRLTSDGSVTEYGFSLENVEVYYPCPHSNTQIINVVSPTCTKEGYTGDAYCSDCGRTIPMGESIPVIDHTYSTEWTIDKVSTCTETGSKSHHCIYCDAKKDETVIAKLGHISSDWIIDKKATCTEDGSKHKECTVCGEVLETEAIAKTGHKSSDWITDKNATASAAGSKHKECTVCGEVLETATIPKIKCAAPKLTKIENASNGIKITWGKTAGADSYNVYRKTYSNGKWSGWSAIKTGATGTSYTDTTAKSGTTYLYTVRAKNAAGLSPYNTTGLKIKFLSTPKLTSISNGSGKVTVKWNKVTGASGYYVYRQTYSNGKWSGWKKVATIKNTYYNDTKVSSSNYYKYTVRAYNGNYISYYNTTGLKIKYLAAPKISSASSRRDGILINWNKISGASGYYVYRKAPSGDWKKIATVKNNTTIKYLDETPRKGVTYQYCVKAYSGNYTSTYANTYKITCKY